LNQPTTENLASKIIDQKSQAQVNFCVIIKSLKEKVID